jgi:threonine aldolase
MRDVAARHGLPAHLDGARLWNASVATGTPLDQFAACADTVMVSFSKGLGAPVGAALAGPRDLMAEGWIVRKRLGGGMRQSGILAAAALYGLEHHLSRLAEDHAHARLLAARVARAPGVRVVSPDTNIVMVDLPPGVAAPALVQRAAEAGVLVSPWTRTRLRAVTHLDVDESGVRQAADVLVALLAAATAEGKRRGTRARPRPRADGAEPAATSPRDSASDVGGPPRETR